MRPLSLSLPSPCPSSVIPPRLATCARVHPYVFTLESCVTPPDTGRLRVYTRRIRSMSASSHGERAALQPSWSLITRGGTLLFSPTSTRLNQPTHPPPLRNRTAFDLLLPTPSLSLSLLDSQRHHKTLWNSRSQIIEWLNSNNGKKEDYVKIIVAIDSSRIMESLIVVREVFSIWKISKNLPDGEEERGRDEFEPIRK